MPTRMRIGTTVQITSISVLCEVCEGTGLAFALKRTIDVDEQRQHQEHDQGDDDQQRRC